MSQLPSSPRVEKAIRSPAGDHCGARVNKPTVRRRSPVPSRLTTYRSRPVLARLLAKTMLPAGGDDANAAPQERSAPTSTAPMIQHLMMFPLGETTSKVTRVITCFNGYDHCVPS